MMTDILKGVVTKGTAASMGWSGNIEAAGKTGTTNGSRRLVLRHDAILYDDGLGWLRPAEDTFQPVRRHVSGEDLEKCDGKDGRGASGGVL